MYQQDIRTTRNLEASQSMLSEACCVFIWRDAPDQNKDWLCKSPACIHSESCVQHINAGTSLFLQFPFVFHSFLEIYTCIWYTDNILLLVTLKMLWWLHARNLLKSTISGKYFRCKHAFMFSAADHRCLIWLVYLPDKWNYFWCQAGRFYFLSVTWIISIAPKGKAKVEMV